MADGNVSRFEGRTVNDAAGDKSWKQAGEDGGCESQMPEKQGAKGAKAARISEIGRVSQESLDGGNDQQDAIGKVNAEHQPGDGAEKQPLRESPVTASLEPV